MGQILGILKGRSVQPSLYLVYLAWVDAWMSLSERPDVGVIEAPLSLKELSRVLIASNRFELLKEKNLTTTIQSFKTHYKTGNIKLGGAKSATCEETDLLSERYDPRTPCHCDGDIPYQQIKSLVISGDSTKCQTVESTVRAMKEIRARPDEWNSTDIFTVESLGDAIHELVWANMEIHTELDTCKGPGTGREIPTVQAPDRRPHPVNDTSPEVSSQLYPTSESIKLCADAKHYFAMAAGASGCDYGLARAIADSGNDILIGDYCEAADETTLTLLWQSGAAAIAFLKLCNLSGLMTNWQFNNLMAGILQFRALGYYRDHSRLRLPDGLYGSRMTNLTTHRYIDLGLFNAVVPASLTTGEQLTKHQYSELVKACALINDLVDFRSDIKRKQRENVVLRGLRGNVCNYLDELIGDCLDTTASLLETSRLCALVLMGFCNWSIMSSHHKVYELMKGMELDTNTPLCQYTSTDNESKRKRLLNALAPFGTLGKEGPNVRRRRFELDKLYATCIGNKRRHSAWLADISRSLLCPGTLRTLVDVVHYQWEGQAGDVEYCP